MPHIAITMIPGRDSETKAALAQKVQAFIAEELHVEKKYISVSIEDIGPKNWDESMERIPADAMYIKPGTE